MIKRYKLQCWNCPKVYFRSLEITDQEEIIVACPYCNAEAVVDLRPYRKKIVSVMRGDDEQIKLPDVLPTKKKK
jgi:DNA-directed RNA polymerase subunit RPC12/RpoP